MTHSFRVTRASILLATLLCLGATRVQAAPSAVPRSFPVDSVRAGMVGVGLSVFEGTRIDTFTVSILGVLKNQQPGTTLVLARAQGDYLERTGIIAGMSGSPVYINGRILGAIAYTWSFSKDPVAGITPIGEMLELLPPPGTVPSEDTEERVGSLDDGSPGPWAEPSSSDGSAPALALRRRSASPRGRAAPVPSPPPSSSPALAPMPCAS